MLLIIEVKATHHWALYFPINVWIIHTINHYPWMVFSQWNFNHDKRPDA